MRQLTRTLLTLFAAVLALWLVVGFWPLSTVSRSVLSICILLVCVAPVAASPVRHTGNGACPAPGRFSGCGGAGLRRYDQPVPSRYRLS
ncbi:MULTISPECIES: hypothetical protein [Enterobacter cloacae complex]|uniref:hypothetical protein n=1 Tax=Enterobacter cloacae complex TaxID=354276 RepID=UPI000FCB6460|nr:hypothetical protein [Enterobacter hormaechei]EHE7809892.1 hypothetical protein [Enterobacter hormaechei]EHF3575434.1 hypothetical protein [Enterobacter hormaechei]MBE8778069.1 hypothetical protein [Enterobacter hormaechei]MCV3639156.1 hypothetical protein [Enterobacter hormaechei]MDR9938616.1 hypothetical protein [Enterobacter hormaechei subsp. xiangfangensis]